MRRGISLTEVLIAMFIMLIGLLGLAALVPVGSSYLGTANTYDRSSALGRAAFRDLQVRDYLDESKWLTSDGRQLYQGVSPWVESRTGEQIKSPVSRGMSFCIDPLFVAFNPSGGARVGAFPAPLDNDPPIDDGMGNTIPQPRMFRGTLAARPAQPGDASFPFPPPMPYALADRIFRSRDDVTFGIPDGTPDARPIASADQQTGARLSTGDYSWLFTITPKRERSQLRQGVDFHMTASGPVPVAPAEPHEFVITAVTFRKRLLDIPAQAVAGRVGIPPTERMVYCDLVNGDASTDVRLRLPTTAGKNDNPNSPKLSDFPPVSAGDWLMLCAWVGIPPGDIPVDHLPPTFRWYRVSAASQLEPLIDSMSGLATDWVQNVSLDGPDLGDTTQGLYYPYFPFDAHCNLPVKSIHACLFTGVVGVFEKTVTLDTSSFGVR